MLTTRFYRLASYRPRWKRCYSILPVGCERRFPYCNFSWQEPARRATLHVERADRSQPIRRDTGIDESIGATRRGDRSIQAELRRRGCRGSTPKSGRSAAADNLTVPIRALVAVEYLIFSHSPPFRPVGCTHATGKPTGGDSGGLHPPYDNAVAGGLGAVSLQPSNPDRVSQEFFEFHATECGAL